MRIKHIIYAMLITLVVSQDYRCNQRSALKLIKKPVYNFSVRLLQRVAENSDSHFVFSPISTWAQLSALADGATAAGTTFQEIWNITRHFRPKCFKQKQAMILKNMYRNIKPDSKKKSVIVIDKFMGVKKSYIRKIEKFYGIEVLLVDFKHPKSATKEVNEVIKAGTGGAIDEIVYYDDFLYRIMILSDANYFKLNWKFPFNSAYTTVQPFYSSEYRNLTTGKVKMMNQIGYFNLTVFPILDATVLELPCENRKISMLVFLPIRRTAIKELYYKLEHTRLTPIFKQFEREHEKLVNVSLPKFRQWTETENLAELIYDMGVRDVFDPYKAELRGISNETMYASFMTQVTHINVDEKGVTAGSMANFLIHNDTSIEFLANKPFVYMIVDKETEFMLFSGIYSSPSVV